MAVEVLASSEAVSDLAFEVVAAQIIARPNSVLGLATGSTPLGLYRRLATTTLDWSSATTFNLDEYVGLLPEHPQSYHTYMWHHLFGHVNIRPQQVHIPSETRGSAAFEARIASVGGIDLQILGIGSNGHIGFNEPGASHSSRTRVVSLAAQTLRDNARFFADEQSVPRRALTMGIGTILESRRILLMACGAAKAPAIAQALQGPVTTAVPASALQRHHDVLVLIDEAAACCLS